MELNCFIGQDANVKNQDVKRITVSVINWELIVQLHASVVHVEIIISQKEIAIQMLRQVNFSY